MFKKYLSCRFKSIFSETSQKTIMENAINLVECWQFKIVYRSRGVRMVTKRFLKTSFWNALSSTRVTVDLQNNTFDSVAVRLVTITTVHQVHRKKQQYYGYCSAVLFYFFTISHLFSLGQFIHVYLFFFIYT